MPLFREQRRAIGRSVVRTAAALRQAILGRPVLPTLASLPQRILIIRPFFLGDIILSLPVAQAIRRHRPDAHIAWLVREEWRDLLPGHSVVDEIIPFSKARMHSAAAPKEFLRVARELRCRRFDMTLNLAWDRSSTLWSQASGAPVRLGIEEYGRPRLLALVNTATVAAPERSGDRRQMADFYYEPLRLLGFELRTEPPKMSATVEEQRRVDDRLDSAFPIPRSPFVLIHPGGRLRNKRWPAERFAELIRALAENTAHPIVLTCGPGEEPWVVELAATLPAGRSLFWPSPSLGELMAFARRAAVLVANDSGPAHLAAAAGCRVVALFGTDPARWHPLGPGHEVLGGAGGMTAITPSEVLGAIHRMLIPI